MSGAAAAMTIIATASSAPMTMGSQRRSENPSLPRDSARASARGRSPGSAPRTMAMLASRLSVRDPRIDDRVEHVDDEVHEDDDHGEDRDRALRERIVPRADRVHEHL